MALANLVATTACDSMVLAKLGLAAAGEAAADQLCRLCRLARGVCTGRMHAAANRLCRLASADAAKSLREAAAPSRSRRSRCPRRMQPPSPHPGRPGPGAAQLAAAAAEQADALADTARTLGGRMTLRPPRGVVEPTLLRLPFGDFVQQDPPQHFFPPKDSCVAPMQTPIDVVREPKICNDFLVSSISS